MKKQINPTVNAYLVQSAFCLLLLSAGTFLAFLRPEPTISVSQRTLTFAQRVTYQRAIEEVYWRHRIWPKENLSPKPSLDAVMSQAQLENKVAGYLRESQVLEDDWQMPITAEQLQAEMDRMARDTKQPEVLRELFEALGSDPFVIAECLARPVLSERLITSFPQKQGQDRLALSKAGANSQTRSVILANASYLLPTIPDAATGCAPDTWTATSTSNAPTARDDHTAVWTGSEMIVWGGQNSNGWLRTGGKYNPSTDSWTATSTTNAPSARDGHTAVWTGREMIVWGGVAQSVYLNTGARYNPVSDTWAATSITNAPEARDSQTAVWTGSEMIVWGGSDGANSLNTGGRYNPITDSWIATATTNAPSARYLHAVVWTGSKMITWGGQGELGLLNTGGRYDPTMDSWIATATTDAPAARRSHTAVWSGSEMIVWGGEGGSSFLKTGGRYDISTDSWAATSTTNAPTNRAVHTAVWTGSEMIIWGGENLLQNFDTGGRYDPSTDSWAQITQTNEPARRALHTAVWTGSEMIIWGGSGYGTYLNTGGKYCSESRAPTPTPTPTVSTLGNISTRAFVQTGDNVMIGGFIVQGTGPKTVIIRAIGPELSPPPYNIPNALADPTLELHDGTEALIASNDNWRTTVIGGVITDNQASAIQDSGHAPTQSSESAIIAALQPGDYTAIVRGVNNAVGVALVEVYDLSPDTTSILGNISTRGFVQTGDNVMIGGFIVQGTTAKTVIVRAIGPELGAPPYNVPNALANPTLELHDGTGALIASNDDWHETIIGGIITSEQWVDIRNSGHTPTDTRESAIIATLPAGNYTAIVRGVNNTTGVALVEVYDLDQ